VEVLTVTDGTRVDPVEGGAALVVVVSGEVVVDGASLGPRDVLVATDEVVLHGAATAALVTVRPAGPA